MTQREAYLLALEAAKDRVPFHALTPPPKPLMKAFVTGYVDGSRHAYPAR